MHGKQYDFKKANDKLTIWRCSILKEMKEQIIEAFERIMKSGEIKAEQIRDIVQTAVSDTAGKVKEGGITLREIAREASTTATDGLKKKGIATRERITAAVEGAN
jgi:translation elongation factor EF-G